MPIRSVPTLTPTTSNSEFFMYSVRTVDLRCCQTSLLGKNIEDKTVSTGMLINKAIRTVLRIHAKLLFCLK